MAIVGQNALLNQYVPTFFIKDLRDGQTVRYDSIRKAFVNAEGGSGTGADRLGGLLDVSDSVDNPLALQNGQGLVYNSVTSLWENKFIDYNTLLNKPNFGTGTVTTVSIVPANGISGTVANATTTPAITLTLGAITPTSVTSTGAITGANLTGTNTGDQLITLTGDITGSGTGTFVTALSNTGVAAGTYGNNTTIPQITVDSKGRITGVTNVSISGLGLGTVTSVSATGAQGVTTLVTNGTTTPNITVGLGNITPTSVAATGAIKAVSATIDLSAAGSTNVGAALPAGATVLSVKVNVTAADTATGTLVVGKAGGSQYMTASENDTQSTGLYMAECYVVEATGVTVQATVGGTPGGSGSATVIVTYKVAG